MYALSVLYEKGLGVDRDVVEALNLHRRHRAWTATT